MTALQLCAAVALGIAPASSSGRADPVAAREQLTADSPAAVVVDASSNVVFGLRWRRPVVRLGAYRKVIGSFGRPGISTRHNLVIVGQGEGQVRALRIADGREVWRYEYGAPFETSISLIPPRDGKPEIALAAARDGAVLALSVTSGEVLWTGKVDSDVRAPITLVNDTLLVTTVGNKVHALAVGDGTSKWSDGRPAPTALTVEGHGAATHHEGVVYAAFSDGYVEAFRFDDGARLWSRPLSLSGGEFIDAEADPVIADGRLFVASYSEGIFALDPEQGQTIWHRPAPSVVSLASFDDEDRALIIAASADGYLWALDRVDGELTYRTRIPAGAASRLTVREGFVVMTAGYTGLLVLNGRSGRPLQATAVTGSLASDPAWSGDYLAAISDAGYLYAFSLGDPGMIR